MDDKYSYEYFMDEVRDGFFVPGMMKRLWMSDFNSYEALQDVCDELGVNCSAVWGTLLGAVRHGGFVPWDDDIDIEMKRDEYVALEEYSDKGNLADDFWISDYKKEETENLVRRWMSSKSLVIPYDEWKDNFGFPFVSIIDIFIQDYIPAGLTEEDEYWDTIDEAATVKEMVKDQD